MKIYRPLALFPYSTLAISFWACDEESTATEITFEEDYSRSKFYTSCDPDQNVDTDVTNPERI